MASPTITTASLLSAYYDRLLLDNLYPDLYFWQFGDKKRIPPGQGKIVFFTKYTKFTAAHTTALNEASLLGTCAISASRVTATLAGYGMAVKHSDFLIMTALSDVISDSVNEVSKAIALRIDNTVRTAVSAAGNLLGASAQVSPKCKSTTATRASDIIRSATTLRSKNAKTFPDGKFVAIAHPNVLHDIQLGTSGGGWIDVNKYATNDTAGMLYRGEVGSMYGVRFVMSSNIPRISRNSASATSAVDGISTKCSGYNTYIFGPGAYGCVELDAGSAKTYIKQLGSAGTADPINQQATVGAKIYFAAVNLDATNRLVRLASGKTFV